MGGIGWVVVAAVAIAAICVVFAFAASVVITYWPIVLILAAATVAGVVYKKRVRDMV